MMISSLSILSILSVTISSPLWTILASDEAGSSQSAASAAQRVMASYMRQFTSGRRTWLDVMNAVREATSAEIDAVDARITAQSSLLRISLLSGRWAPETVKSVNP